MTDMEENEKKIVEEILKKFPIKEVFCLYRFYIKPGPNANKYSRGKLDA